MIKGKSFTAILSRVTVKEICEGHQTKREAKKKKRLIITSPGKANRSGKVFVAH